MRPTTATRARCRHYALPGSDVGQLYVSKMPDVRRVRPISVAVAGESHLLGWPLLAGISSQGRGRRANRGKFLGAFSARRKGHGNFRSRPCPGALGTFSSKQIQSAPTLLTIQEAAHGGRVLDHSQNAALSEATSQVLPGKAVDAGGFIRGTYYSGLTHCVSRFNSHAGWRGDRGP